MSSSPIYQFHPDDLTTPIAEFPTPLAVVQHLGAGLTVKLVDRHLTYNKPKKLCGYIFSRTIAQKPVPKLPPTPHNPAFLIPVESETQTPIFIIADSALAAFSQLPENIENTEASADAVVVPDVPRGTLPDNTPESPDSWLDAEATPIDESCYLDDQDADSLSQFIPASALLAAAARNKRKKPQ